MSCKGRPKGQVRYTANGSIEHLLEYERKWVPAVYHNDIRAELIGEAAIYGQYGYPRNRGRGPTDETSFLPAHKTWGPAQKDWPAAMFHAGSERNPEPVGPKAIPLWYRGGRLLLDDDNDPLRFLPHTIPATCSSEMESWELQAIYNSDPRIVLADIRARMPKTITQADGSEKPLFKLNAISMRMTRFRIRAGLSPSSSTQNSPKRFERFQFQGHEEARQTYEPKSGRRKNKRLVENTAGSDQSSATTGSPTKRARKPRLQSVSTVSDNLFPKLTRSESSASADYNGDHETSTQVAAFGALNPQDLFGSHVPHPNTTVGLGLEFQMFSDAETAKTRGYSSDFVQGIQEDPFYNSFLRENANTRPKPVQQQRAKRNTGDIFMPDGSVAYTGFAQNGTISLDLTDFIATLSPIVGYGSNGLAMNSGEQTSPLEQTDNAALSTGAASAVRESGQNGGISEDFAEFLARLDASTGYQSDGVSTHAGQHTSTTGQTANTALLTDATSADKELEPNGDMSEYEAEFLATLVAYNSNGASKHAGEQTSLTEQTGTSPRLTEPSSTDLEFEQSGGISTDVAEFLARFGAENGYNSEEVAKEAAEQTSPLKQTENLDLFTGVSPADTAFVQDESPSDFLAELVARCPAIIGYRLDGTPIYQNELTSSLAQSGDAKSTTATALTAPVIDQPSPFKPTKVLSESDTVTATHRNSASQESTSASSATSLCNRNDLIPSWQEDLYFFEPLDNLIARGFSGVENGGSTEEQSPNMQNSEAVEVASTLTTPTQTIPALDEDELAALAELPDIIGFDQHGAAIWADGFRFPEPNAQSNEPQEPQYFLTLDDFAFDDEGNLIPRN
ncbi:hypothetical protein MMC30_001195 [Trapelia coarctata]|nr:hypothetical protein [Trapelia coarctata]